MPYFIYRISPRRSLTYVDEFVEYVKARKIARNMRRAQLPGDDEVIKIIFAKDRFEAETLLKVRRERQPSEDD